MTIQLDIPKEFESHFSDDRFKESFQRLDADAHMLAGNYERELLTMLIKAFQESHIIDRENVIQGKKGTGTFSMDERVDCGEEEERS